VALTSIINALRGRRTIIGVPACHSVEAAAAWGVSGVHDARTRPRGRCDTFSFSRHVEGAAATMWCARGGGYERGARQWGWGCDLQEGGGGGGVVEEEKKEGGRGRNEVFIYSIGEEVRVNATKDSLRISSYCGCQWRVRT
jgi:hypothetical protein